jgi:hypothetical protein
MENARLYIEIENIIRKNLYYAYNKNTAKVYFNLSNDYPAEVESLNFRNFSISFSANQSDEIKYCCWRLPQTRIYFSELNSSHFKISELSYFNVSVILIQNYEKAIQLRIDAADDLYEINGNKRENIFQIDGDKKDILCFGVPLPSSTGIVKFITDQINDERSLHPMQNIFSTDISFLKEMDSAWCLVPWKSKSQVAADTNNEFDDVKSLMLSELTQYIELPFKVLPRKKIEADTLQYFWNVISLPALKNKLINELKNDSGKVITFLLSAYENNFWWAEKARNLIHSVIRQNFIDIEAIFNFLFILKSNFNVICSGPEIAISDLSESCENSAKSIKTNTFAAKFVKSKNSIFTYATFPDIETISINKKAIIKFNLQQKIIQIHPQTYQFDLNSGNKIECQFDSVKLEVLAVWKDFIVTCAGLRLTFLFKKNRFQISIKGSKSIKDFLINGHKFNFKESSYFKYYYIPDKIETSIRISYTDHDGREIETGNSINPPLISVMALDRYGMICDNLRIRKKTSKRSFNLSYPGSPANKIDSLQAYELIVPKDKIIDTGPLCSDYILNKILYTKADILEEQLCIFLKDESKSFSVRRKFFDVLGLYVSVKPLTELNTAFSSSNIIVSDKPPGKIINTFTFYDEILLKRNGQKKVIFMNENNLERWLRTVNVNVYK